MDPEVVAVEAGDVTAVVDRGQTGCARSWEVDGRELALAQQKPVKVSFVIAARLGSAISADDISASIDTGIPRLWICGFDGAGKINRRQLGGVEQVNMKLPVGALVPPRKR